MPDAAREVLMREAEILVHPLRYRIIEALATNPEGLYINQLADRLKEDKQLVSFHLLTLASHDFVDGDYVVAEKPHSKGRAVKVFRITAKVRETLAALEKELGHKLAKGA